MQLFARTVIGLCTLTGGSARQQLYRASMSCVQFSQQIIRDLRPDFFFIYRRVSDLLGADCVFVFVPTNDRGDYTGAQLPAASVHTCFLLLNG